MTTPEQKQSRSTFLTVTVLVLAALLAAFSPFLGAQSVTYAQTDSSAVLAAPTLTADNKKANRVELSWSAVEGAASYELKRWHEGADDWYVIADQLTGTTHTDGGVEAGKTYFYIVRGLTAEGAEGAYSDYTSEDARATVGALDAPALRLAATPANAVELSWDAVAGAASYDLWRLDEGGDWIQLDGALTATTYTDSAVEAGKTYSYAVRGLTAEGAEGAWSDYRSDDARATIARFSAGAAAASGHANSNANSDAGIVGQGGAGCALQRHRRRELDQQDQLAERRAAR